VGKDSSLFIFSFEMKKFLYKSSVFILIFVVINALYLALIAFTDWNFKKRIESLTFKNPEFDVLILGNSLAMDGFDTELMTSAGLKSYNLAIGGSSLKTSLVQLNEYIGKYAKAPKYVVLGLGSYMSSTEGESIHPIVEFTRGHLTFSKDDLPIVKFEWLGAEFAKKIISSVHRSARLSFGQLKFEKRITDITPQTDIPFDLNYYTDSFYISELAALCQRNGIKMFLIEMPGFNNTRNNSDIGPNEITYKNGARAYLFNFNSREFCKIFNPESDWVGNSHLNASGSRKFTSSVMKYLFHISS
jgi:hypothetical protein